MALVKKKFFQINLPVINQAIELLGDTEESLIGRSVKIDLTRRLRGKSMEAIFHISKKDNKLLVKLKRTRILGYFIRRMMRKSVSYVEDSFSAQCKNAVLTIKPFLITRKKASREVTNALRNK